MENIGPKVLPAGLSQARSSLSEGMQKASKDVADAANSLQRGFAESSNRVSEIVMQNMPEEGAITPTTDALVAMNEVAMDTPSPEASMVKLLEASNAYLASAKGTEIVNEVEQELLEVLK